MNMNTQPSSTLKKGKKRKERETDCMTIKDTEWSHDSDSYLDEDHMQVAVKDTTPTRKLLSLNNSYIIDSDKDSQESGPAENAHGEGQQESGQG